MFLYLQYIKSVYVYQISCLRLHWQLIVNWIIQLKRTTRKLSFVSITWSQNVFFSQIYVDKVG